MKIIFLVFLFIPFFSFSQKDSTLFRDKFYVELNGGIGRFNYSKYYYGNGSSPPELIKNKTILGNVEINVNFRNKWFKAGGTLFSIKLTREHLFISSALTFGVNIQAFSKNNKNYFGPYLSYGKISGILFQPSNGYFGFGMDLYLRKIHLDFYYSKINEQINVGYINMHMYGLNIGYAFNLESFRKKKK